MDLEIAIINLISQIPMSIWLYNDGRTISINRKNQGNSHMFIQPTHSESFMW